jgi:hypothetical protein
MQQLACDEKNCNRKKKSNKELPTILLLSPEHFIGTMVSSAIHGEK